MLDLFFRLNTPRSVCKWKSHFWMWFSDSPHHHITSADIIMEITLLDVVFRLTRSCLQEYGDQPFWAWFSDSPHYTVRAKLMETTLLYLIYRLATFFLFFFVGKWRSQFWTWFSDSLRHVLWANGDHNFGLGFPTHYVTFCGQMEITVLDLVFQLTTSRSVDKWRSQFQTWFSDSLRHLLWANEDHNFRLGFHSYTA